MRLLIATGNTGKFKEFNHFLSGLSLEMKSLADFPGFKETDEPFHSFEENARHKAISALRQTGWMSLADDSGLEVDALGGAPGVRSARYAGENASDDENNSKLLRELEKVGLAGRTARFHCVLALAISEDNVRVVDGQAQGLILFEPRGDKGFGYDPLFLDQGTGKSFAEMDPEAKLQVSHRGDALRKMRFLLMELMGQPGLNRH